MFPTKLFLPEDVTFKQFSLSATDIKAIRQSWGLAKDAAPFEVHGPAFYHLYKLFIQFIDIFMLIIRMFVTHPPCRYHFNHMGGHLPIEDHIALPR